MDKIDPATFTKLATNISRPLQKLESMASAIKTMQVLQIIGSPKVVAGTFLVLALMSIIIYLVIEFASKNRFRGISWGIFTKLISLNSYILKFNDQIFIDFTNIYKYVDMSQKFKNDKVICFNDPVLLQIHGLMTRVKKRADKNANKSAKDILVSYVSNFFSPNPSFPASSEEDTVLRQIFKDLYGDRFHDAFGEWLQHESIWNFVYADRDVSVEDKLLPQYANKKINKAVNQLKTGDQRAMRSLTSEMKLLIMAEIKEIMFNDLLNSYSRDERSQIEDNLDKLFFRESKSLDYGNISQQFEEKCSLLNDQAKKLLKERLKLHGFGIQQGDTLSRLNKALSFADALDRLHQRSYKVDSVALFRGVPNLHNHLKQSLKTCLKQPESRRASLMINACFQVFNEFIYFKVKKDGHEKFLFLKPTQIDDIESNTLAKKCIGLFNMHIYSSNKSLIDKSVAFKNSVKDDDQLNTIVSTMSSAHVSIARLKFLIQDYFVIINEYNDKSNPDKEDIKDFWEKRVNSFGIPIPGTKNVNKPKKAPDIDYISNRTRTTRSDDPFSEDLDRILIKNTPFELYKEYVYSIFVLMRHPKIPFFQSIMATIRYFIPDPNVVIDNFLKQLKGETPTRQINPLNYDFSMSYNPYVAIAES